MSQKRILEPVRHTLQSLWRYAPVRIVIALLALFGLLYFFYRTRGIWIIFLLAFLVAYLVQPLMNWAERRLRARWAGLVLFLLGFFLLLGTLSALVAGLIQQLSRFVNDLPALITQVEETSRNLPGVLDRLPLPGILTNAINEAYQSLEAFLNTLAQRFLDWLEALLTSGQVVGGVTVIAGDVIQFFAFLAIIIYLLADLPQVQESLKRAVPLPYQATAEALSHKLEDSVGGYFRGQIIIALLVGVFTGVGFTLFGVPLGLLLGFLAGIFNLVPYLGAIVSLVPALLLAAGVGWLQIVGVLVVFTLVNQLETHLLSPLILGRTTRLHPVTVILAILIGAQLFGLLGAVFAVPIAAFLKLVFEDYYVGGKLYREG